MTMRQLPVLGGYSTSPVSTERKDSWWFGPALTLVVLLGFIAWTTFRIFEGSHYYAAPYLSPLFAPVLFTNTAAPGAAPLELAWFGHWPSFWPALLPASPALLILPFPGSFRFTCYYYRKAYYRAFAGSPPACAVVPAVPGRPYRGETGLMVFQNLHRYALYFALIFNVILAYDAFLSFFRDGQFGIGVGSIVMTVNAVLLAAYSFGCHSFRHLIGGHDDCMSCGKETVKYGAWKRASWFNARHMQFAWASLIWVVFTDVYVRLVSMGVITDLNTWS
jgi:hypothetical protein